MRTGLAASSLPFVLALAVALSGCSLKKMAVNSVAGMLSESGATFSSDNDPELVRDALVHDDDGSVIGTCVTERAQDIHRT